MTTEYAAKKLADSLLRSVGLTPTLPEEDPLTAELFNINGEVTPIPGVSGGFEVKMATPIMGVPSGTLLPTACMARYRGAPKIVDPDQFYVGTVLHVAPRALWGTKEPHFMVELPGITRHGPVPIAASDIELAYVPIDWGKIKRTRAP